MYCSFTIAGVAVATNCCVSGVEMQAIQCFMQFVFFFCFFFWGGGDSFRIANVPSWWVW